MEKIGIYIVLNLKDGGDIQPLYTMLTDPNINFAAKYKPVKSELDDRVEIDEVDHEIYREEVKQFVQRKINLRRNLEKVYGLIRGSVWLDYKLTSKVYPTTKQDTQVWTLYGC